MTLYILRNNQPCGPFNESDVIGWLESGDCSPNDLAWREGLNEWQPLITLIEAHGTSSSLSADKRPAPVGDATKRETLRRVIAKLESIEVKWLRKPGDEERDQRHFEAETNEGRFTGYLATRHSHSEPNDCTLRVWLHPPEEGFVELYFEKFDEANDRENWEFLENYFQKILAKEYEKAQRYRDRFLD